MKKTIAMHIRISLITLLLVCLIGLCFVRTEISFAAPGDAAGNEEIQDPDPGEDPGAVDIPEDPGEDPGEDPQAPEDPGEDLQTPEDPGEDPGEDPQTPEDPGEDPGEDPQTPEDPGNTVTEPTSPPEDPQDPGDETGPEPDIDTPDENIGNDGESSAPAETIWQSIDTRLLNLSIACGELSPKFSSDVYEYTVYVTKDQDNKNCTVAFEAADTSAEVTVDGPDTVGEEDVEVKVVSAGPNGESSTYTIKVHVVTDIELLRNGKLYRIAEAPDLAALPDGFVMAGSTYKNQKITVAESKDGNLQMVQYVNVSGSKPKSKDNLWYRLDTEKETLYPAKIMGIDGNKAVVIAEDKEFVYGASGSQVGYYIYNQKKGITEFLLAEGEIVVKEVSVVPGWMQALLAALAAVAVIFAAAFALLYKKYKRQLSAAKQGNKYFRPYLSVPQDNGGGSDSQGQSGEDSRGSEDNSGEDSSDNGKAGEDSGQPQEK